MILPGCESISNGGLAIRKSIPEPRQGRWPTATSLSRTLSSRRTTASERHGRRAQLGRERRRAVNKSVLELPTCQPGRILSKSIRRETPVALRDVGIALSHAQPQKFAAGADLLVTTDCGGKHLKSRATQGPLAAPRFRRRTPAEEMRALVKGGLQILWRTPHYCQADFCDACVSIWPIHARLRRLALLFSRRLKQD